jgi:hypothetical protein
MPAVKFFACLDFGRKSSFCKRLYYLEIHLVNPVGGILKKKEH